MILLTMAKAWDTSGCNGWKSQWLYLSKYQLSYNSFRSLDVVWQLSKLQAHVSDIYNMRDESQSVQSVI